MRALVCDRQIADNCRHGPFSNILYCIRLCVALRFIVLCVCLGECSGNAIQVGNLQQATCSQRDCGNLNQSIEVIFKLRHTLSLVCDRHSDSSGISGSLNKHENTRRASGHHDLDCGCLIHVMSYSFRVFRIPLTLDSSRTRITLAVSITRHQV